MDTKKEFRKFIEKNQLLIGFEMEERIAEYIETQITIAEKRGAEKEKERIKEWANKKHKNEAKREAVRYGEAMTRYEWKDDWEAIGYNNALYDLIDNLKTK